MAVYDAINPLQGLSYTNKDFLTVYPELLDLIKQLTSKWDPSISNESDPGVVLVKLNAIIADKLNYNIDTNVLECFPLSVTQTRNARLMFELLGYFMHWYRSATCLVSMLWIDTPKETGTTKIDIPFFTQVTDVNREITFTLIGPHEEGKTPSVGSGVLKLDGTPSSFDAIQGDVVQYDINGELLITADFLDYNNRLYFDTIDIAENGIFITNAASSERYQSNFDDWIRKDNLYVEELGNTYYKFGVSQDTLQCYLEFPEDAAELFKNGIYIWYVKTKGADGNTAYGVLSKFRNDRSVKIDDVDVMLDELHVKILNVTGAFNGEDTETINEAYIGYKRTIGTFTTLVTLRDYINASLNSKLVSNGFVCDKTNDIQSTYNIITSQNGIRQRKVILNPVADEADKLTAFGLKLYMLQYVENVQLTQDYLDTFEMNIDYSPLNMTDNNVLKLYLEDSKCIVHDYVDLSLPKFNENSNDDSTDNYLFPAICYFKNKYPLDILIVPQYNLSIVQKAEVEYNILQAIIQGLNSKKVDFGEEVTLNIVYDLIMKCDARIKSVYISPITYTTYACLLERDNDNIYFKEVELPTQLADHDNFSEFSYEEKIACYLYSVSVLNGNTLFYIKDDKFLYNLSLVQYEFQPDGSQETMSTINGILSIGSEATLSFLELPAPSNNPYKPDQNSNSTYGYKYTYELNPNEFLYLYQPSLAELANYSNYVKFEYVSTINTNPISANENYELLDGEYIIFYYRSSSEDLYSYTYYKNDTSNNIKYTICPTIQITPSTTSYSLIPATNPGIVNGVANSTQSSNISAKTNLEYLLNGSKKISMKGLNRITLPVNYFCYWITNDIIYDNDNNKHIPKLYRITFDQIGDGAEASGGSYILKTGEYFIYTDSNFANMSILGAGTRVFCNNSDSYCVEYISVSSILQEGLNAFQLENKSINRVLSQITTSFQISVLELQYNSFGFGSKVNIYSDNSLSLLEILTNSYKSLSGVLIGYEINGTEKFLPKLNISGYGVLATSALNVDFGPSKPLKILNNQSITLFLDEKFVENRRSYTIHPSSGYICIEGSFDVVTGGLWDFPVAKYNLFDAYIQKLDVYLFTNKEDINGLAVPGNTKVLYSLTWGMGENLDTLIVDKKPTSHASSLGNATINIKDLSDLLPGSYLFTVRKVRDNTLNKTTISFIDGDGHPYTIMNNSENQFNDDGDYIVLLDVLAEEGRTLNIKLSNTQVLPEEIEIRFSNFYQFKYPYDSNNPNCFFTNDSLPLIILDEYITKMDEYKQYDSAYLVNINEFIYNPLIPKSFFNASHPMNKFTIALADFGRPQLIDYAPSKITVTILNKL